VGNTRLQASSTSHRLITRVRILESNSGLAQNTKIADTSGVIFGSTYISYGSYTEKLDLFTSEWPAVFFLSPEHGKPNTVKSVDGLVLRRTAQGQYERIGSMQPSVTCFVERIGQDRLRLTAHISDDRLLAVLECVRSTITLV